MSKITNVKPAEYYLKKKKLQVFTRQTYSDENCLRASFSRNKTRRGRLDRFGEVNFRSKSTDRKVPIWIFNFRSKSLYTVYLINKNMCFAKQDSPPISPCFQIFNVIITGNNSIKFCTAGPLRNFWDSPPGKFGF